MTYQEIIEKLVEWGGDKDDAREIINENIRNMGKEKTLKLVSSWLIDPPVQTIKNNKLSTLIIYYTPLALYISFLAIEKQEKK